MALGDSKSSIAATIERELTKDGAVDAALAQKIAVAVAEAMDLNNRKIDMVLRQQLQVAGLIV